MVGLYVLEVKAEKDADVATSMMYDWWFYATHDYQNYPNARRVQGSVNAIDHDRVLPSEFAAAAEWTDALHGYVAMYEWASIFHPESPYLSPKVHMPLHELVHRVDKCESGLSDAVLVEMIRQKERSLVGYTRMNPFAKVDNATPR